jgi:hypothetical protein
MARVARLESFVDANDERIDPGEISVSARHEAELDDGRRVLLLDGPGWSASGPPSVLQTTSLDDVVLTTRTVVGPDEPFHGRTVEDMAADHWTQLAGTLQQQEVVIQRNAKDVRFLGMSYDGVVVSGWGSIAREV